MARGRTLKAASGNLSIAFLADCFDSERANDVSAARAVKGPDTRLFEAYTIHLQPPSSADRLTLHGGPH